MHNFKHSLNYKNTDYVAKKKNQKLHLNARYHDNKQRNNSFKTY